VTSWHGSAFSAQHFNLLGEAESDRLADNANPTCVEHWDVRMLLAGCDLCETGL